MNVTNGDIGKQIETLDYSFRGLWRSCELFDTANDEDEFNDKWYVTFIYKGRYVETPAYDTASEALNFAIEKHLDETDEKK